MLQKKYPTAKFIGPDVITQNKAIPEGWNVSDPELVAKLIKQYKCDAVVSGNGC